jgi:hypothetical protein
MSGRLERKSLAWRELKASEDGAEFEGLAAAFKNVDDSAWPDILALGCFAQELAQFLADQVGTKCLPLWLVRSSNGW